VTEEDQLFSSAYFAVKQKFGRLIIATDTTDK
jgi:hypothetical protein